mmetsp:Transcript_24264/g.77902  ORF Transcript_24264/g.77902 Transcript_24264/m.77902 type:complete len:225 (+) Transcript_24264:192-866(+)
MADVVATRYSRSRSSGSVPTSNDSADTRRPAGHDGFTLKLTPDTCRKAVDRAGSLATPCSRALSRRRPDKRSTTIRSTTGSSDTKSCNRMWPVRMTPSSWKVPALSSTAFTPRAERATSATMLHRFVSRQRTEVTLPSMSTALSAITCGSFIDTRPLYESTTAAISGSRGSSLVTMMRSCLISGRSRPDESRKQRNRNALSSRKSRPLLTSIACPICATVVVRS